MSLNIIGAEISKKTIAHVKSATLFLPIMVYIMSLDFFSIYTLNPCLAAVY